ncbi:hypothetical protein N7460_007003 [Penicillium canescens]|uniref:Uncharacterized protein n=1 Tax=Penicillium canescens TaxID=5083 RepID=A0AAD6IDI1_PENCN|nr:hypothetical protein N7460_007003 [Penicillium canescens]KAJ6064698.1 hypothetical protein N7444_000351 [Penicillium canescens]
MYWSLRAGPHKGLMTIPQQQFLAIAALLKLFILRHQPFLGVLQVATFLFHAYLPAGLSV